ncbi:hypothetical protein EZV62_024035 [Acer yangbiense]|uniref:Retrotransposon Copia-like N-terminal domain-containing protein n=1 Tax=Acer yangbiense TaxID=1000413 RepID=A0A5C7H3M1_9ROSI|nr:hypothetical protein EZV62_024035 [Acer yangbiense]
MVPEHHTDVSASSNTPMSFSNLSLHGSKLLTPLKLELVVKLDYNNFLLWRQQVTAAIKGNRLQHFIDSSSQPPNRKNPYGSASEAFLYWEQQDQILL